MFYKSIILLSINSILNCQIIFLEIMDTYIQIAISAEITLANNAEIRNCSTNCNICIYSHINKCELQNENVLIF